MMRILSSRAPRLLLSLGLAAGLLGAAGQARAVTVTVDSIEYTIGTETGTYNTLVGTLDDQPWYGEPGESSIVDGFVGGIAHKFALAVGDDLGTPNPSGQTPYFAFIHTDALVTDQPRRRWFFGGTVTNSATFDLDTEYTFAVVNETAVIPLPAGLPLILTGLGALAVFRVGKRKGERRSTCQIQPGRTPGAAGSV